MGKFPGNPHLGSSFLNWSVARWRRDGNEELWRQSLFSAALRPFLRQSIPFSQASEPPAGDRPGKLVRFPAWNPISGTPGDPEVFLSFLTLSLPGEETIPGFWDYGEPSRKQDGMRGCHGRGEGSGGFLSCRFLQMRGKTRSLHCTTHTQIHLEPRCGSAKEGIISQISQKSPKFPPGSPLQTLQIMDSHESW